MISLTLTLPWIITIAVVIVALIILVIVGFSKANKAKESLDSVEFDKNNLKLKYDTLQVDYNSLKLDLESSVKNTEKTKKEFIDYTSQVKDRTITIEDELPKSMKDSTPDLSTYKDFRNCWMKLQNKAFRNKSLEFVNGKIRLKLFK